MIKGNLVFPCLIVGCLWLAFIPGTAYSQARAQFKVITTEDGLSNSFVRSIFQDRNGFMWIGTVNGLNRYDGHRMTNFIDDPLVEGSFKGTFVFKIYEDRQENIWVLSDKGLNCLNPATASFEMILPNGENTIEDRIFFFIKEDQQGNLWLNRKRGLYQFDSDKKLFEAVKFDERSSTYSDTRFLFLEEDQQGRLWLGSKDKGLIRLSENKREGNWSAQQFIIPNNMIDSSATIRSMVAGEGDFLWLATSSGIYRFDTRKEQFEPFVPKPAISFLGAPGVSEILKVDTRGRLLFTTSEGIYRIEQPESFPLAGNYSSFKHGPGLDHSKFIYGQWIRDFVVEKDNRIWVGTEEGLYHVNMTTSESILYAHDPLKSRSLSINRISQLFIDDQQNLWAGTYAGGINISAKQHPFQHYTHHKDDAQSLSSNQVRSMVIDDAGFLWVATLETGLDKMELRPGKGWVRVGNWQADEKAANALPGNSLIQVIKARSGKLWIALAAGKGLTELDPVSGTTKIYRTAPGSSFDFSGIWALCEDQQGYIWIGTRKTGVHRFDPVSGQLDSFLEDTFWTNSFKNNFIHDIYEDRLGQLWISSFRGLYRVDPVSRKIEKFLHEADNPQSISSSAIWTVGEDKQGNLWIGTSLGLNKYDRESGHFQRYFMQDGLPSNVVWGMLTDNKGYLWVSTDAGLARYYKPAEKEPAFPPQKAFQPFDQKSLNSETFLPHAYYKDERNGQLFFGSLEGFNIVYPDQIKSDTAQSPMVLSTFSIYNQAKESGRNLLDPFINNKEEVELSYLDDVLVFTFSDLNFPDRGQNYFEYQLIGLSDQWIPLEESKTMTFIDLAPSSYVLKMRGVKPNGYAIHEKSLLKFIIHPPWWKSNWAYLFYGLSLLGCFFFFKRYEENRREFKQQAEVERARAEEKRRQTETVELQAQQLERSLKELQQKNEEILIAQNQLIQQEKLASLGHLTAGIAHEIKNPLNFINNFAEDSKELLEELSTELEGQKAQLDTARLKEMRDMISELKLNAKDIHENGIRVDRIVRSMMNHATGSRSERREVNVNQLLSDNANLAYHGYRALDASFHVHLEKELDDALPLLSAYPQELGRVLLNLINNACHATQQKQKTAGPDYVPTILVSTATEKDGVLIRIRDNGTGIPESLQEEIFTPFFTTKPTGEGNSGLGLSISYDIVVQQHQGTLEVKSELGEFTEFVIQLPL